LQDLEGSTTGQVLSKTSNTDMDFTWVTSDDANAIQNAIVDAKGDIVAASAADTPARLAVGTDNHRLVAASGETTGLKYVADTQNTVIDAEGDLLVGDAADALQRLAVGTTGQVLTVDTTVDGKVKWATPAGGGGKVLQVVNATYDTEVANSTTTYADSGLTATITPSSATSTVLIFVEQNGIAKNNADTGVKLRLLRGATELYQFEASAAYTGDNAYNYIGGSGTNYLDSPATTSATTYKTQFARTTAAGAAFLQIDGAVGTNSTSTITLMEIGA
jgi:hypothetical protein